MSDVNVNSDSVGFTVWMIGWLFTIGYLELSFGSAVFAFIAWPALIGLSLA